MGLGEFCHNVKLKCRSNPRAFSLGAFVSVVIVALVFYFGFISSDSSVQDDVFGEDEMSEQEWEKNPRLSEHVNPTDYQMFFNLDNVKEDFDGRSEISLNITGTVSHLRIHSKRLTITEPFLEIDSRSIEFKKSFEFEPNEYWIFVPLKPINPGVYNLTFTFSGKTHKDLIGLYRSKYLNPVTMKFEYILSTKFQPTYARLAFPCFDEPNFKSTYTISLTKPSHLVAISNMPIMKTEVDRPRVDYSIVHFEKSVPMVTYLVMFAIGDFSSKSPVLSKNNVPVRVYSTSHQVHKSDYSRNIAVKVVNYLEKFFEIKYPLPKLDLIAIPDYVSGATEHWGAVTFREENLLYDSATSDASNKQRIAFIIAHELVHMWFGNLVTLKWWNDLWLNEGFASFLEYLAVDEVEPTWEAKTLFVPNDLLYVLNIDAKKSSHPIVQPVSHPDQITEIFDAISYQKVKDQKHSIQRLASSVIRMLRQIIGEENFRVAVHKFLTDFKYKNAVTQDLWEYFQKEISSDLNITTVMHPWLNEVGFPLVNVEVVNESLVVSQQKYTEDSSLRNSSQKWEIPIWFQEASKDNPIKLIWLGKENVTIPLSVPIKWVKVNTGQLGYFRANYSSSLLNAIKENFIVDFSPEERCGVLDDVFTLSMSGILSYNQSLPFLAMLKDETHYVPWSCAESYIWKLLDVMAGMKPTLERFKIFLKGIVGNVYEKFEWNDQESESHLQRLLKPKIFNMACQIGHEGCLNQTKQIILDFLLNGKIIEIGLRSIIYKWGSWQLSKSEWSLLWNVYLAETDSQEKIRLLRGLGNTNNREILNELLISSKNESLVKRQDYFTLLRSISNHQVGNEIIWNFYRNNYTELVERFSLNNRYFGKFIITITDSFTLPSQLQEAEDFFLLYPKAGAGARARLTAVENIKNNINWLKNYGTKVHSWLSS